MTSPTDWLAADRADLAATRILDIAESLFVARGVASVTMRDVADAVGCSRATLYRHFPGRDRLLAAYVERTATIIGTEVAERIGAVGTPADRLVAAIETALSGVRRNPALSAWFDAEMAGMSTQLALLSPAIDALATGILAQLAPELGDNELGDNELPDTDLSDRAGWLVRVMVSLLAAPAPDADTERDLLTRFVVPVVLPSRPPA
ncbi:transcriptional regulator, TetR family [Gordonia polyisoprenivorans VH2]|uniref:Transcriptional regulator, TetR family n=1 Tax=Gordonia polyisoprenivorans (strain DSM 44266 / VH2) TaxID=1112204 RepID=H6N0H7_GORPV|nr:TetR/AcrR family transcriptional regulator [Gordonia polyisoprenivorans]AFA72081.1 transcriptional regulator, TetR family [Gordonia polyisoprenivorans VH2]